MNQLYFEGKVVNLYAEDYQFLQDSITDKVQATIRYLISNHDAACIVQGFHLTRNTTDETKFDITHPTWNTKGVVITGEQLLFESTTTYISQSLKDYTYGQVMGVYAYLDYVYGSYDRKNEELVQKERKGVDLYDNSLVYNRILESVAIVQLTLAEYAALTAAEKIKYICLGHFTSYGSTRPLSFPDYTDVHVLTLTIGDKTITVDKLAYSFMLPQGLVCPTSTGDVDDKYYNIPSGIDIHDDLNHIRTMIRDIKGTASWDEPMEGVVGSVPQMNDLWKVGVFDNAYNHFSYTITSTGTVLVINSGVALTGTAVKTLFESTNLYVPPAPTRTIGVWIGTPPENGIDGEHHTIGAAPDSFTLYACFENYVQVDVASFRMIHTTYRNRVYTIDVDFTLDPSTGVVTSIPTGILGAATVECFYTYSAPRTDAVVVDSSGIHYKTGTAAAFPIPPKISHGEVPLYYINRINFKEYIEESDIVDVRQSRSTNRESTSIDVEDIGFYKNNVYYPTRQWSFQKYSIMDNSTGKLSPKGLGWNIVSTSTGDAISLNTGYIYQTIVNFQDDDEFWINATLQKSPYSILVSIENEFNSGNFTEQHLITVPLGSSLTTAPAPIFGFNVTSRGFYRIKLQGSVSFYFSKILIGKYDNFFIKEHLYTENLTANTLKASLAELGAISITWAPGSSYTVDNLTIYGDKLYRCEINHVSTNFYTDLAFKRWFEVSSVEEALVQTRNLQAQVDNCNNKISDLMIENSIIKGRKSNSSQFILDLCNSDQENNMEASTAKLLDDNTWNNNWTEVNGEYFQGLVKPQQQYFIGESIENFSLEEIGQIYKCDIVKDVANQCFWFISCPTPGDTSFFELTKLSKNLKKGKVSIMSRWFFTNPAIPYAFVRGISVYPDGSHLVFTTSCAEKSSRPQKLYKLQINSDGTIGKRHTPSGQTISLATVLTPATIGLDMTAVFTLANATAADIWSGGVTYWSDPVNGDHIGVMENTTVYTSVINFVKATDDGAGAFTAATLSSITFNYLLDIQTTGGYPRYQGLHKEGNILWVGCNSYQSADRGIFRFDITTDIFNNVAIKHSGRFITSRNVSNNGSYISMTGITLDFDGDLLEVVGTESNGNFLAKRALSKALWSENQICSQISTNRANAYLGGIFFEGDYMWYGCNSGSANACRLYKKNLVTGAETYCTLTGGGWTYLSGIVIESISGVDYVFMIGQISGGYVSRVISKIIVEAALGSNLDVSSLGYGFSSYETAKMQNDITSNGSYLFIINDTDDAIDRWTLAYPPVKETDSYITIPAATTTWYGISYKNNKFYLIDYYSGGICKIPVINSVPVANLASGKTSQVIHYHQDPHFVTNSLACAFKGYDLFVANQGTYCVRGIKVLEDPDVLQMHTFLSYHNVLLSQNVACSTPIVERYFKPEEYTEELKFSNLEPTLQLFHGGYYLGSINRSSGYNWSISSQSFTVNTGAGAKTITLTANCATPYEIITHINTVASGVTGANVEAFIYNTNYIGIRSLLSGDITVSSGTADPATMFGWITAVPYTSCYLLKTVPSVRNVLDPIYMVIGYGDEGMTILGLSKYFGDMSSTGKPRYDVTKITTTNYKRGTNNLIPASSYIQAIYAHEDMIFFGSSSSSYAYNQGMIDLKTGRVTYFWSSAYSGKSYVGTLLERNSGKGYTGTYNPSLDLSSAAINRFNAKTFTKEDPSEYKGANPKTFVHVGNAGGSDLLVIDWDENNNRTPVRVWNNVLNASTYGNYASFIADSGRVFFGDWANEGTIYEVTGKPYIWNIEKDTIGNVKVASSSPGGYTADISPNSVCFKTPSGSWRHILLITTLESGATGVQLTTMYDIENATREDLVYYNRDGDQRSYGVDNSEDRVFNTTYPAGPAGLRILTKMQFDDHSYSTLYTNGWSCAICLDSYNGINYKDRPRWLFNGNPSTFQIRYSKKYQLLPLGYTAYGLQFFHFSQSDLNTYVSKDLQISNSSKVLYKSKEKN